MDNSTTVMAWGKCKIEILSSTGTTIEADIVPKEGTTTLNVTEGDKTEAIEEGGGVVAVRYAKDKYELDFTCFQKISGLKDDDGVITGTYGAKLTPEEDDAPGLAIPKCNIKMTPSFSSADGWGFQYKCSALRPSTGSAITIGSSDPSDSSVTSE